jgi:protein involved in polysaccharide export with SLBB domain
MFSFRRFQMFRSRRLFPIGFALGILSLLAASEVLAQAPPPPPASAETAPANPPPGAQNPGLAAPAASATRQSATSVSAPSGYRLAPNDAVAVEVFGEDDLRTTARIGGDGAVTLPLLGPVQIGGLTLTQAADRLTDLYQRDYLVSPRVNVTLVAYAKARFTVLGQVNRPGSYEMPEGSPDGVDILDAIAMAGGYTRIAAPERITVRRKTRAGDEVIRVNAKRLARQGGTGGFRVQPGDRITVGESIF